MGAAGDQVEVEVEVELQGLSSRLVKEVDLLGAGLEGLVPEALNLKQQREGLDRNEEDALDRLTEAYERFLLLRAEAASLLRRRGHDVSELIGPK